MTPLAKYLLIGIVILILIWLGMSFFGGEEAAGAVIG